MPQHSTELPTRELAHRARSRSDGRYVDAYPATLVELQPRRLRASAQNGPTIKMRLSRYLEGVATLGITDAADISKLMERAKSLWSELSHEPDTDVAVERRRLAVELAAGDIDVAIVEERLRAIRLSIADSDAHRRDRGDVIRRAVDVLYDQAAQTVADASIEIVAALNTVVADAVKSQTSFMRTKATLVDAALSQRYETAHSIAAGMRGWALDSVSNEPRDAWRYRRPDLVHHWKLDQLDHAPRAANVGAKPFGTGPVRKDGLTPAYRLPFGVTPTLADIAAHPEWEPAVVLADELVEINNQVGGNTAEDPKDAA